MLEKRCIALVGRRRLTLAAAMAVLAIVPTAALAQGGAKSAIAREERFEAVRALVREQMAQRQLPSVAVAVAWRGRVVLLDAFGLADKEALVPATPDTMYRIASVTKPLTATGVMMLVEAGKVDLDRPINDYLGEAKLVARVGEAREATVRRVANHTAGLPQHWQFFYANEDRRAPSVEETILHYGGLVRPPGETYEYTNLGYGVLGEVIARASGRSYADYMRAEVFTPLGMTHTAIEPDEAQKVFLATPYDQRGARLPDFRTDYPGGAGAHASARDLIRFSMFHLKDHLGDQKRILSDESLDEMRRATAEIRGGMAYGVGWRLDTARGTAEHGGYYPGASAVVRLAPDEDAAVVVLTNISNDDQATALNLIADAALKAVIPSWKPRPAATTTAVAAPTPFVAPPALVGQWTGVVRTYVSDMPLTIEFLPTGEFARARLGRQPNTTLHSIRYQDGVVTGEMHGVLDTPDTRRSEPYLLKFELKPDGSAMTGTATTRFFQDPNGPRLTHWVSLTRP